MANGKMEANQAANPTPKQGTLYDAMTNVKHSKTGPSNLRLNGYLAKQSPARDVIAAGS